MKRNKTWRGGKYFESLRVVWKKKKLVVVFSFLYLTKSSWGETRGRKEVATIDAIPRAPVECPKNRGATNPSTTKTDVDPHCWRWLD